MAFSFGLSKNYTELGRGLFHITTLMWTNAANALTFLSLEEQVRQHFCWDMLNDDYQEAVEVPMKAGIILMLLLTRIGDIPLRYKWNEQAALTLNVYGLQQPHQLYDDFKLRASDFDKSLLIRNCKTCCINCIPGFADIVFIIDDSINISAISSSINTTESCSFFQLFYERSAKSAPFLSFFCSLFLK